MKECMVSFRLSEELFSKVEALRVCEYPGLVPPVVRNRSEFCVLALEYFCECVAPALRRQ